MKTSLGTMIILQKAWDEGQITRKNSSSVCTPKAPLYFMQASTFSPSSGALKENSFCGTPTGRVLSKTQPSKSTLREKQTNKKGMHRNRKGMHQTAKTRWEMALRAFRCCWKWGWGWRGSSSSGCKSRNSQGSHRGLENRSAGGVKDGWKSPESSLKSWLNWEWNLLCGYLWRCWGSEMPQPHRAAPPSQLWGSSSP